LAPGRMAVALAAGLLCISPEYSDAWEQEPLAPEVQLSCTLEQQRCLEKWQMLKVRLHLYGEVHDWSHIEDALLKVHETDPVCAFLLRDTGSLNF